MKCPECGQDVAQEAAVAHAESHWPEEVLITNERGGDSRHFQEARSRKTALLTFGKYGQRGEAR